MTSSLYIHIPFCKKKCDYCDFFSIGEKERKGKSNDLTDEYIESLLKEAEFYAKFYGITEWNTIYAGGGTPSLLSSSQILNLFNGLKKIAHIKPDTEITFEMNPDDVTEEFLSSCKKAGINRLSMGIQALDDKALKAVHRGSSVKTILNTLEILKNHWDKRLSVDFIAGLPNHTYKSFENQFEILKKYPGIDHISLYTLTIEENTPLAKRIDNGEINFSQEKADKMWIKGRNILEKLGFLQYEISNFSRKGFESRHNTTYWKQKNYIGIGSGATGTFYDFEKKQAERWTDTLSIPEYLKALKSIKTAETDLSEVLEKLPRKIEGLSEETLEFEFLMLGFRQLEGVSSSEYNKRFRKSLAERIGADTPEGLFSKWEKLHLASSTQTEGDTTYFLNRRGILLLNRFLEELI